MNLEYDIIYSERRSIAVTVERDHRVVVHAPRRARPEAVAAAVETKRFWIWSKLRDPQKFLHQHPKKEFVVGESFLFLGQNFALKLVNELPGEVRLNGRHFELSREDQPRARELFVAWYRRQAALYIPPRALALTRAMGVSVKRISIRGMKYRWGSCSIAGAIAFNWRIVQAPVGVVDYVVAHELAHIIQPSHAPEFWDIVAVHAPAWQMARTWLRRHGPRLEW